MVNSLSLSLYIFFTPDLLRSYKRLGLFQKVDLHSHEFHI